MYFMAVNTNHVRVQAALGQLTLDPTNFEQLSATLSRSEGIIGRAQSDPHWPYHMERRDRDDYEPAPFIGWNKQQLFNAIKASGVYTKKGRILRKDLGMPDYPLSRNGFPQTLRGRPAPMAKPYIPSLMTHPHWTTVLIHTQPSRSRKYFLGTPSSMSFRISLMAMRFLPARLVLVQPDPPHPSREK